MLIRNAAERAGASTAYDERFSVARVMERLKTERELDPLERALERDYHVLAYLIQHAADLELASIENRLLLLDYKLMRVWSHLTRKASPERSRQALTEMASVLGVLVRKMGEQNGMQEA